MTAGADWLRVCPAIELKEQGDGVRFELQDEQGTLPAFVLRLDGQPRAWLNRCAHVPVELDWMPGRFLDDSGRAIVCATHGAVYDAASGRCRSGPCRGRGLHPLTSREHEGWIEVSRQIPGKAGQ